MSVVQRLDTKLAGIWAWVIDGIALTLPDSFKSILWKEQANYYQYKEKKNLLFSGIIEQSWLGEERRKTLPGETPSPKLPAYVELCTDTCFRTQFTLPAAIGKDIHQAIKRKLKELSPLPEDQIIYRYTSAPSKSDNERLTVDLFIARRKTLQELHAHPELTGTPFTVGPSLTFGTNVKFTIDTDKTEQRSNYSFLNMAVCFLAVFSFVAGIEAYAKKITETSQAQQVTLISEIRKLNSKLDRMEVANRIALTRNTRKLSELQPPSDRIVKFGDRLVLESIRFADGQLTINGHIDENTSDAFQQAFQDVTISPGPWSGWAQIAFSRPVADETLSEEVHQR